MFSPSAGWPRNYKVLTGQAVRQHPSEEDGGIRSESHSPGGILRGDCARRRAIGLQRRDFQRRTSFDFVIRIELHQHLITRFPSAVQFPVDIKMIFGGDMTVKKAAVCPIKVAVPV